MGLFPAPPCCCKQLFRCAFSCKSPVVVYTAHDLVNSMGCYAGADTSVCIGQCLEQCAVLYVESFLPGLPGGATSVKGWLCWDGIGWSGAGTLGSQWFVRLSSTTDGTGCRIFTLERAELQIGGDRIVWTLLPHCPAGDDGNPPGMVVDATDTAYFAEGCPDIIANWHHAPLSADPPASVSITIAGATGPCCDAVNGTHVLPLWAVSELLTSPCLEAAGRMAGSYEFRKTIATPSPGCPTGGELTISLVIGNTGCALYCQVSIGRGVPTCTVEFQLTQCPFCVDATIDLAGAERYGGADDCDGVANCDLSDVAISGEIVLGAG